MKDVQAYLEKLRASAAECELLGKQANDPQKKELFTKLAEHHRILARELEREISTNN